MDVSAAPGGADASAPQTALGRIGEPYDIGKVIAALLSEDFAWVTGEHLEVSGGYRM